MNTESQKQRKNNAPENKESGSKKKSPTVGIDIEMCVWLYRCYKSEWRAHMHMSDPLALHSNDTNEPIDIRRRAKTSHTRELIKLDSEILPYSVGLQLHFRLATLEFL